MSWFFHNGNACTHYRLPGRQVNPAAGTAWAPGRAYGAIQTSAASASLKVWLGRMMALTLAGSAR